MAKVAAHGALTSGSLQICGDALKVGPTVKRKTPSELRVLIFLFCSQTDISTVADWLSWFRLFLRTMIEFLFTFS